MIEVVWQYNKLSFSIHVDFIIATLFKILRQNNNTFIFIDIQMVTNIYLGWNSDKNILYYRLNESWCPVYNMALDQNIYILDKNTQPAKFTKMKKFNPVQLLNQIM